MLTTVDELLTHCLANDKPDRFLNIKLDNLQPHLDHTGDKGRVVETLKHGTIGRYYQDHSLSLQRQIAFHQEPFSSGTCLKHHKKLNESR